MSIILKRATLVLTLFCYGCGQITVGGGSSEYVAPKHSTISSGFEVSQGVGFSGTTSTAATSTPPNDGGNTGAAALAVIGLLALILLADSKEACAGSGCSGGSGGGIALGG